MICRNLSSKSHKPHDFAFEQFNFLRAFLTLHQNLSPCIIRPLPSFPLNKQRPFSYLTLKFLLSQMWCFSENLISSELTILSMSFLSYYSWTILSRCWYMTDADMHCYTLKVTPQRWPLLRLYMIFFIRTANLSSSS